MAADDSNIPLTVKDPLAPDETIIEEYVHSKKVSNYLIGAVIGKGAFATVNESCHSLTTEKVAVKVIHKTLCNKDSYIKKHLRREGKILQQLRHVNIVQLLEIMETENSYYLVLELCSSNLMAKIMKKGKLSENDTKMYLRQLILAIDYLHRLSIMHRDLKVENILLTTEDVLKVADFGVSIQLSVKNQSRNLLQEDDNNLLPHLCKTQCGSPAYAAPEVLSRLLYDYSADIWSIGVNMFAMLTGKLPFTVKPFTIEALKDKMIKGDMHKLPENINVDCKALLLQFLNPDPQKRISLRDAMKNSWLTFEISTRWNHGINSFDINSALIRYMDDHLGFKRTDTVKSVMHNLPNSSHATYHLLLKRAQTFCNLHQLSLSKWLYSLCPKSEKSIENKSLQKLNPFSEITNSKCEKVSESFNEIKSPNHKICEETEYKLSTFSDYKPASYKSMISNPPILTKRPSISLTSAKCPLELTVKPNKFSNTSRVLPHINEISIPYFTHLNHDINHKSYVTNPTRAQTTMQNHRKLSITEDTGNFPKSLLQSSLRRRKEESFLIAREINRPRRFSMGSSIKFVHIPTNK